MSLDLNITYIFIMVALMVPLLILNGTVFQPFLKLFAERHEKLEGAIERAEGMIQDAEDKAAAFQEKIQRASHEGAAAQTRVRAEVNSAMSERLDGEKGVLSGKLESALAEISTARTEARRKIRSQIESLAEDLAGRLLGRSL